MKFSDYEELCIIYFEIIVAYQLREYIDDTEDYINIQVTFPTSLTV